MFNLFRSKGHHKTLNNYHHKHFQKTSVDSKVKQPNLQELEKRKQNTQRKENYSYYKVSHCRGNWIDFFHTSMFFTSAFGFDVSQSLHAGPVCPFLCLALGPSAPDPDDVNNTSHTAVSMQTVHRMPNKFAWTHLNSESELVELLFDVRVNLHESRLRSRAIPDVLQVTHTRKHLDQCIKTKLI